MTITHPERIIFPDAGVTKGDLADYYRTIGGVMLPFIATRPLSLVRCPQGRARKCFFQKHADDGFGEHVGRVAIREKGGGSADYLQVDAIGGLLDCVQMGTIEFHGWQSRADDVEHPDRMVLDLDPDEGLGFVDVRKAARAITAQLDKLGLVSFAMLSGGKGVHVVVPLSVGPEWPVVTDFAKRFATALAMAEPRRYTVTMSKARRKGRIFIDWLRNQRGATSIIPYSARSRVGAPVATPVAWDELDEYDNPAAFTVRDVEALSERSRAAALRGWGVARQELPDV